MAATSFHRSYAVHDERVTLGNGRADVSWGIGAEMTLFAADDMRLLGGPLIEPLDGPANSRPFIVGMGRESDSNFAIDPRPFTDGLGTGLEARRSFPVAGQPLVAGLSIRVHDDMPWVELTVSLTNRGPQPVVLGRLFSLVLGSLWDERPLMLAGASSDFAVYRQGWQSWSFAGGLPPDAPDPRQTSVPTTVLWHHPAGDAPREPLGAPADVVSEGMALLGSSHSPAALLLGYLGANRHFGQIYINRANGSVAAAALLDGYSLRPGQTVELDPLIVMPGEPNELLRLYADALARGIGARRSAAPPTGWSSWYYFYTAVSEADVLANLRMLRTARSTLPLGVLQIDDGYQKVVGDWTQANEKFPGGMKALAERIRDAGFRPGLWLAPFTAATGSRLAREHPDWLVRDATGRPADAGTNWQTTLHGLDVTHPEAREWLRRLFGTLVEHWGLDYLKLDFLVTAALRGQRWSTGATRAAALRDGLELIRTVVGDDVYLVGCGCPWQSGIGIFDAMRIGPDVAPVWTMEAQFPTPASADAATMPSAQAAIRNTLTRAWMHPALWTNDPDCLLARGSETQLTLAQVRALATAIGLTGGMLMLSDDLRTLWPERADLAASLLPPLPERALPTSYFAAGVPRTVVAHIERPWGHWWLAGLFNGEAVAQERTVTWSELGMPVGAYHACEFWSGAYLGVGDTGVTLSVPAQGAAVLALRPVAARPQLLSTSFHLSQGGAEIEDWSYDEAAGILRWSAHLGRHAAGSFSIWLPPDLHPGRLMTTAHAAHPRRDAGPLYVVDAEIPGSATFALELERKG
ncbi:MAG TPA: alpha-galactosidase [Ktedonobacterales bacterium]|nr:alpha-galactosidase [Ktedonobacterales bacterium]